MYKFSSTLKQLTNFKAISYVHSNVIEDGVGSVPLFEIKPLKAQSIGAGSGIQTHPVCLEGKNASR